MRRPASFVPWFGELTLNTPNAYWGALTANFLASWGLEAAMISPGSRSTPLTYAFARHPRIESIPVLDERSAGFLALGLAKRTGRPVALICTSGTATANYYPAIIEARYSHVPLFVLTADRPQELRHCHSGQTIDQLGLYADYPSYQAEAAFPSLSEEGARAHGGQLREAWVAATGPEAGPVHLNFPFRDPLHPNTGDAPVALQFNLEAFFESFSPPPVPESPGEGFPEIPGERGLIVAGPANPVNAEAYCRGVAALSRHYGWPVLAEALGPLRNFETLNPYLISGYDTFLLAPEIRKEWIPDAVLQIGSLPTSKRLRSWLKEYPVPTWVMDPSADSRDPLNRCVQPLPAWVESFGRLEPGDLAPTPWTARWQQAERAFRESLGSHLDDETVLFEGKLAYLLPRILPNNTSVFIANSMPVRDAEFFWPPNNRNHRTYCNRGANGIDGTLSTALGLAHGGLPTVLVTGDLALLHDTNGFLFAPRFQGSLTILCIQNGGGAIFDNLPIREEASTFTEYFRTPQDISGEDLCRTYGVGFHRVDSWPSLKALLSRHPPSGTIRLVEIFTNPDHDVPFRRTLQQQLAHRLPLSE